MLNTISNLCLRLRCLMTLTYGQRRESSRNVDFIHTKWKWFDNIIGLLFNQGRFYIIEYIDDVIKRAKIQSMESNEMKVTSQQDDATSWKFTTYIINNTHTQEDRLDFAAQANALLIRQTWPQSFFSEAIPQIKNVPYSAEMCSGTEAKTHKKCPTNRETIL